MVTRRAQSPARGDRMAARGLQAVQGSSGSDLLPQGEPSPHTPARPNSLPTDLAALWAALTKAVTLVLVRMRAKVDISVSTRFRPIHLSSHWSHVGRAATRNGPVTAPPTDLADRFKKWAESCCHHTCENNIGIHVVHIHTPCALTHMRR